MSAERFGDILQRSPPSSGAEFDPFELLVAVAQRYGVRPEELLDRLEGSDVLARIGRDILGLPAPDARRKRGRPPKDDENWPLFQFAMHQRIGGASNESIASAWIEQNGGENAAGSRREATLKRLQRLDARWSHHSRLVLLMLEGPPADRT